MLYDITYNSSRAVEGNREMKRSLDKRLNRHLKQHLLSVNTTQKDNHSIIWEGVKQHQPGVRGQLERDQGGHSHTTPEAFLNSNRGYNPHSTPTYNHLHLLNVGCDAQLKAPNYK